MEPAGEADADVIVVGAGIAGLTAAWHLRHLRLLVLEAAERAGGRIRSEPRGDYWLNFGPHLFPGPNTVIGRLVTSVGLHTSAVPGSALALAFRDRLLTSGRTWSYPLRLPMSPSARASLTRAGLAIRRRIRATHSWGRCARATRRPTSGSDYGLAVGWAIRDSQDRRLSGRPCKRHDPRTLQELLCGCPTFSVNSGSCVSYRYGSTNSPGRLTCDSRPMFINWALIRRIRTMTSFGHAR
jgi:choline dehydrogenase-like flavoprotein